MRKNSLEKTGLSMSDAQSISNLCNQRALDIENKLKAAKTATKTIVSEGNPYFLEKRVALPENVEELLIEKGKLHACQSFLMENLKAKEAALQFIKTVKVDLSEVKEPEYPDLESFRPLPSINEEWGWEQLSSLEMNEYYENEALAAHIGQFIHKGSKLETLRNELNNLPSIEWKELKTGEKTPVLIEPNHTTEQLQELHEKLSKLHKQYEARTNYFKAKVKNLVTLENGRIAKLNADNQLESSNLNKEIMMVYNDEMRLYTQAVTQLQNSFEVSRANRIKEVAGLRIQVDPRFQLVIDKFITK